MFLGNLFSLHILHGRQAGGLHGSEMDLAELGQDAVESAVDGLECSLGSGRCFGSSDIHNLRVGVSLRLRQAAAGCLDAPDAPDRPLPRHTGAGARVGVTRDKSGHQEAAAHRGLGRRNVIRGIHDFFNLYISPRMDT